MTIKIKDDIVYLRSQGVDGTSAIRIVELQEDVATLKTGLDSCHANIEWLMDVINDMKHGKYRLEYIEEDGSDE
jgi:cell division protein FtsB